MIFRRHHRQAASYRHVTKNTSRQLLWNLHLRDRDARNPFRIRSYENCRVSIQHSHPVPLSPIFRIFFQVPYPVTPLFATLTKTAGVCTNNSHSGTHQSRVQFSSLVGLSLTPIPFPLILLRTLLRFFALSKNSTLFFSRDSALFAQNTGGGVPIPLRSMWPRGIASEVE